MCVICYGEKTLLNLIWPKYSNALCRFSEIDTLKTKSIHFRIIKCCKNEFCSNEIKKFYGFHVL